MTDGSAPAAFPVFLLEAPDGRMLYGLPDQGHGLKLAEHHGGVPTTADSVNRDVSRVERETFHAFASRWVRGLPAGPSDSAVCLYTNTPDSDFVLDWHPGGPGRIHLQRLLGARVQVRAGHRRRGRLGRRNGRAVIRSVAV